MLSVGACDLKLDKVRASRHRCSAELSCHWDVLNLQPDLAFTADFNKGGGTTPEPGTLALFVTGLACAVGVIRRRMSQ